MDLENCGIADRTLILQKCERILDTGFERQMLRLFNLDRIFELQCVLQITCRLEISERVKSHALIGFLVRLFSAR